VPISAFDQIINDAQREVMEKGTHKVTAKIYQAALLGWQNEKQEARTDRLIGYFKNGKVNGIPRTRIEQVKQSAPTALTGGGIVAIVWAILEKLSAGG
jgi:hypothetical protein